MFLGVGESKGQLSLPVVALNLRNIQHSIFPLLIFDLFRDQYIYVVHVKRSGQFSLSDFLSNNNSRPSVFCGSFVLPLKSLKSIKA